MGHIDIHMGARREPDAATLQRLIDVIRTAQRPLLIHCNSGSDRTGLAAALFAMVIDAQLPEIASGQLSFRYGHFPWLGSKTVAMDRTFWRIAAKQPKDERGLEWVGITSSSRVLLLRWLVCYASLNNLLTRERPGSRPRDEYLFRKRSMDWFEMVTGFRESNYDDTHAKLKVEGSRLRSLINGKSYGIGELELVSLHVLRERAKSVRGLHGRLKVSVATGDVRQMHRSPLNAGALFQVASQFNLLEMVCPKVMPEDGVTRYQHDPTQGPACAIAAGAATIYRNYFAPVGGGYGQTAERQFDGLADIGQHLADALNQPVNALWRMQHGYALCTRSGLDAIAEHLSALQAEGRDFLRGKLCIGIHRDVEVTDAEGEHRPLVSQAFCSALPVAYTDVPPRNWKAFASLVLEAAYEATILAALLNAQRGASKVVLLAQLGGGAFGNRGCWIHAAMRRALKMMAEVDLDVKLVSRATPSRAILQIAEEFN